MGAGGRMEREQEREQERERVPHTKPPFTVADIKKAIPPHCFEKSVLRSSYHLIHDLVFATIFYYIATNYIVNLSLPLQYLAWPIYWTFQGCILTGLWVIAHECGHQNFSDYPLLDDTVGLILHTSFLTPYLSWKISHRRHHANTASLERDEVYVPKFKTGRKWFDFLLDHPPGRVLRILVRLTLGWPLYLCFNVSGRKYEKFACHYDPNSPIFSDGEQAQVLISNAAILAAFYGLYSLAVAKGAVWLICVYGVPLLIVNGFFVLITYLNHTHAAVPHYDSTEWDWLRGALATVDRNYGILNYVFHHVADAHVVHHLVSTIPHYHGIEATNAIKPVLGKYYHFDGTPIVKAMWREAKECVYIESDPSGKGVYWFNNKI
ncbi:hypothetical protein ACJIZ3_005787 [Penstemon smallii]|uniref:Fatty acid desaturase n=1 Tax=Penstemon smallii TaxID=265156 RepID=A0ABD3S5Z8_9LAMI